MAPEHLSQDTAFRETEHAEDERLHAEVRARLVERGIPVPLLLCRASRQP